MTDLNGKTVLITGGARTVGAEISRHFARLGARVIVNYFHAHEAATALRDELVASGADVHLARASVAQPAQVERMFADIEERFGGLNVLVNNAADGALLPVDEVSDADLDRALDVNLKGALRCSRAAARIMTPGASIVMVSALGGSSMVMANYLACAPAKAAAETLARYLAVEYAERGIRVNVASAAMLDSDVADKFPQAASMQHEVVASTPLGRLGQAHELAGLVAFLASDAASWITGQVVLADGGLSLGSRLLSPSKTRTEPTTGKRAVTEPAATASATPAAAFTPDVPAPPCAAMPEEIDPSDAGRIAVVGMGMAVAGANSPDEFWQLRMDGDAELFVPVPEDRWERAAFHSTNGSDEDKSYQDHCVFITNFIPHEASAAQPGTDAGGEVEFTTAWLRHSLVQALDGVSTNDDDRFSFNVGYTPDGSQHLEEAGVLLGAQRLIESAADELGLDDETRATLVAPARESVAKRYERGGVDPLRFLPHQVGYHAMRGVLPVTTDLQMIDTACSSSLYAIDIGAKGLLMGRQDIAVCGGAFALAPRGTVLFSKLQGLSKRGEVHSLDASADGVIFADGAAVVVLKRLDRARRDGDQVLGVLEAFGSSSDGKGKAIYAPNAAGQNLAVQRAYEGNGLDPNQVGWVNAHATGTPTGDLAEFSTLRRHYGRDNETFVTSNKSLIGHTGWAAGVVSLIECLIGMREGAVPTQAKFVSAPRAFDIASTALTIPTSECAWPAPADGRRAAVSGFGFGGTNAHLVVREETARPTARTQVPSQDIRVAIVGWSAHLPGIDGADAVRSWLDGGAEPTSSFGETYPSPPFKRVKLPPPTVRSIDRCQLMMVECAHLLREQMPELWDANAERASVVVGHLGPTRAAMLNAYRCYRDDLENILRSALGESRTELEPLLDKLRQRIRGLIPASNEDSFPGQMPNIISARVANYFNLNGPNMTIDSGFASTLSAIETASRYVRTGEVDMALVGGINGNSLPEYRDMLEGLCGPSAELAEGAFLFALISEEAAAQAGLPVLGWVGDYSVGEPVADDAMPNTLECGVGSAERSRFLGASGAVGLLKALHGNRGKVVLTASGDRPGAVSRLEIEVEGFTDGAEDAVESLTATPTATPTSASGGEPAGAPSMVARFVPELVEVPARPVGAGVEFLPTGCVIITDCPQQVLVITGGLGAPEDLRVLSTVPLPAGIADRPGWQLIAEPTADAVDAALGDAAVRHVRVVSDLSVGPQVAGDVVHTALLNLHDLTFLVVQCADATLSAPGSSVLVLSLSAVHDGVPTAATGLFGGLIKCVYLELPNCLALSVLVDTADPLDAARTAVAESELAHTMPIVVVAGGQRREYRLRPEPAPPGHMPLDQNSVVVALGGARGITAEVLVGLAQATGARIHLLGSNPLDEYPDEVFVGTDEQFAATRSQFIRTGRARADKPSVGQLNHEFERRVQARAARRNIERMAAHSGEERVTYHTCDARDARAVRTVLDEIRGQGAAIDLVVNAAGQNHSARIKDKDVASFRSVRNLKLDAYRNLRRALADKPPRLWCNFGSLLGFFGQVGESDYAAANDLLASAAASATASGPHAQQEFTIGWTLWGGVGMGAGELTNAYYERAGSYSHMPVDEGVHAFLAELAVPERRGSTVHLGAAEEATVETFYPGFLTAPVTPPADVSATPRSPAQAAPSEKPTPATPFFLRSQTGPGNWECAFDLDQDAYLTAHRVRGVPTLPGLFVTELAAEAGRAVVPGTELIAVEDLTFHHFLRVNENAVNPSRRIRAEVLGCTGDVTRVTITISGDVIAPSGIVLVPDRVHFTATAVLAQRFPNAPTWRPWPEGGETPLADPYHAPGTEVLLTGPFECTRDTRLHPMGKRAAFLPPEFTGALGGSFTTPVVLLDAMARTGALAMDADGLQPIAAPLSVRRIDLYQRADDRTLARTHGAIELYSTPAGFDMRSESPSNRAVAVGPDGQVLAQLKDIAATVVGFLDSRSGGVVGIDRDGRPALPGVTMTGVL